MLGYSGCGSSYGTLSLTESSPAQSFTEPLTLDEMRSFLALPVRDTPDAAEDAQLQGFISGAREIAEMLQGRDLVRKQYDLAFDYWPADSYYSRIRLRPHLSTVDLVQYRDSDGSYATLAENVDYVVDASKAPGLIAPVYSKAWPIFTPWPSSAVLIRFTAGLTSDSSFWADAGTRVKIGMRLLIAAWWEGRVPFEIGRGVPSELPYSVTLCLSAGAVPRVR